MSFPILDGLFFWARTFWASQQAVLCASLHDLRPDAAQRKSGLLGKLWGFAALHHAKTRGAAVLPSIGCGGSKKTAVWGLPICRERIEQTTTWVPSALANRFCRMMLCYGAMETYNNLCWWQSAAKLYMLQAINMTKTLCMDLVQRGSRDAKPLHLDGIFVSTNGIRKTKKKNIYIISVDHCYEVWITWEQKWNYIFWSF